MTHPQYQNCIFLNPLRTNPWENALDSISMAMHMCKEWWHTQSRLYLYSYLRFKDYLKLLWWRLRAIQLMASLWAITRLNPYWNRSIFWKYLKEQEWHIMTWVCDGKLKSRTSQHVTGRCTSDASSRILLRDHLGLHQEYVPARIIRIRFVAWFRFRLRLSTSRRCTSEDSSTWSSRPTPRVCSCQDYQNQNHCVIQIQIESILTTKKSRGWFDYFFK